MQTKLNTKLAVYGPNGPTLMTLAELLALPDKEPVIVDPTPTVPPVVAPTVPDVGFAKYKAIDEVIAKVGEPFSYAIPGDAFTSKPQSLDVSDLSRGLGWDSKNRTIIGTPIKAGSRTITITAQDDTGRMATNSFTLTITADLVSDVPVTSEGVNTEWEYENGNQQA